jgi:protein phosphatase
MRFPIPEPDPFGLRIEAAARSDRGLVREGNEDRAVFADAATSRAWEPPASATVDVGPCSFWAVVCDGMGGEDGGEIASDLAVRAIASAMRRAIADIPPETAMVASIEDASQRIKDHAKEHPRYSRMGTTATLAMVCRGELLVGQVGDSRAYVFHDGALFQLTRDQTMAEMMRDSGLVPIDEDGSPIGSNVILQAVGSSVRLDVVVTRAPITSGDIVLLCSDGLHGVVDDERIAAILTKERDLARACERLVAAAHDGGAPDNVTCVLFRVA